MDGLVFLGTLEVEFFVFGKEHVVLLSEMVLEVVVPLMRRLGLLLEELVLNRVQC
jgi:hypothetical protein